MPSSNSGCVAPGPKDATTPSALWMMADELCQKWARHSLSLSIRTQRGFFNWRLDFTHTHTQRELRRFLSFVLQRADISARKLVVFVISSFRRRRRSSSSASSEPCAYLSRTIIIVLVRVEVLFTVARPRVLQHGPAHTLHTAGRCKPEPPLQQRRVCVGALRILRTQLNRRHGRAQRTRDRPRT